ncbi:MAG: 30S ribosomal protein S3 [Candidatus Wolfebacteria bacterium GW2011_GWA2_42_10]|uniref:Small ribosomal subunit protein uS3 n=3 Tax=root TaxID=1 RepID=A0A0G0XME2_9BACT|nr:30S ribosomal protein S3 [uncultured organism]KKR88862.1 MAG: 30S ribosomal protein S3 [Candidatus Wolfebacteria bacterium GW2011_GWB1_41_12]KKS25617.1 MAG: 30S ribosomal protein S3 [Candidatus Wolfebacteria bacterium GW2011_GWA2_42_10]KKT56492.1 MAG: 30S ribosomal protein S3 [Candidatus Wolfebacteria bacterium GW2011_GWA1_44_24]
MGHKIRPNSLRLGIIKDWNSRWFPKKFNFQRLLEEDVLIRAIIEKKIGTSGIDKIDIERMGNKYKVSVKVSRPGLAIGKGGKGIEDLIKAIESFLNKLRKKKSVAESFSLNLNIEELKRSEISASVVAQNIAWDFEKRMPFRRTIKKHIDAVMANKEIKGARIKVAGRLDGAEIARTEQLSRGRLPLQTLRANIDYGQATAYTTYGTIGIKVWAYKGDIFNK